MMFHSSSEKCFPAKLVDCSICVWLKAFSCSVESCSAMMFLLMRDTRSFVLVSNRCGHIRPPRTPQHTPQAKVQVRWWTLPSSSISSSKTANTPFDSDRLPTAFSTVRAPRYVRECSFPSRYWPTLSPHQIAVSLSTVLCPPCHSPYKVPFGRMIDQQVPRLA